MPRSEDAAPAPSAGGNFSQPFIQNITHAKDHSFLRFDVRAEEAMDFYLSIFRNSKALKVMRYGDRGPGPKGSVMMSSFSFDGQEFVALNGGPHFNFTPAVSFVVECDDQAEVDEFWSRLSASGEPNRCDWLTDKFGLSWQIVPRNLPQLLGDPGPLKAQAAMAAMKQMTMIEIEILRQVQEAAVRPAS